MADSTSASRVIPAPAEDVFAVLADPATHAAIDGTGWVCDTVGNEPLTTVGQIFRMEMFHPNHPDGNYRTANRVEVFEPPMAISWRTGYDADDGTVKFGGWFWRYDLAAEGASTTIVTLTYDWTATSQETRDLIGFPPFPPGFLGESLDHLAAQVAARR